MKIPQMIKLSEEEAEQERRYYRDSMKDEDGLIEAIKNNIRNRDAKNNHPIIQSSDGGSLPADSDSRMD